jgi:hypothetical protein
MSSYLANVGHPFDGCPQCPVGRGPDDIYDAGKVHRAACHVHRTTWFLGANLLSSWRRTLAESGGDWSEMLRRQRERWREIQDYVCV